MEYGLWAKEKYKLLSSYTRILKARRGKKPYSGTFYDYSKYQNFTRLGKEHIDNDWMEIDGINNDHFDDLDEDDDKSELIIIRMV